jgi:serine/threonine protein kinase
MTSVVGTLYYACPEIIQHMPYNEKAGLSSYLFYISFIEYFLLDIWSLGCVLYHMSTLVPPFYTSNILQLAGKICASDYDQIPLKHYSDRIRQIIIECLCIDPLRRPDICGVAQLCTEQLMLYTDRSSTTIQTLEKRLTQQDHQREMDLIKQQSQLQQQSNYHQRCLSCSSTKESLVSNSGGLPDVSFDGTDGQHDTLKADTFTAGK